MSRASVPLLAHVVSAAFLLSSLSASAQAPGSLDTSFIPATGFQDVLWALAVQPDGRILVCGRQDSIGGVIYRLKPDGTLDTSFTSGPRATYADANIPQMNAVALQANSNIVCGGQFAYLDGQLRLGLARLTSSGGLDSSFTPGANGAVSALAIQADGKILLGGSFSNFQGSGKNYLARILPDGSWDTTFNPQGPGPQAAVSALALDSDGKILIGGDFTSVNGFSRSHVARLLTDGSVDTTFTPAEAALDGAVRALAIQPDRKVLIGGAFLNVAGVARGRVARLDASGALDPAFAPLSGCDNYTVWALAVQVNGRILAAGRFTSVNGQARSKIVRFTSTGEIDGSFDPSAGSGTSSSDEVRAVALQSDGAILLAGKFTSFSGQTRYGLARLHGDPVLPQLFVRAIAPALVLDWSGPFTLQSASQVSGPYTDVAGGANPPFSLTNLLPAQFFRLRN